MQNHQGRSSPDRSAGSARRAVRAITMKRLHGRHGAIVDVQAVGLSILPQTLVGFFGTLIVASAAASAAITTAPSSAVSRADNTNIPSSSQYVRTRADVVVVPTLHRSSFENPEPCVPIEKRSPIRPTRPGLPPPPGRPPWSLRAPWNTTGSPLRTRPRQPATGRAPELPGRAHGRQPVTSSTTTPTNASRTSTPTRPMPIVDRTRRSTPTRRTSLRLIAPPSNRFVTPTRRLTPPRRTPSQQLLRRLRGPLYLLISTPFRALTNLPQSTIER